MRERVIVVSFSVGLSVKITSDRFSPGNTHQTGEDHNLLALNVCQFFDKICCLGEKASQTCPIEIVLCVTPPLKVHMLSR